MSSSSEANSGRTAPRRRNGRQQACEPCHKRKVACDHRLPVCSRCRRGNIADACVYLVERNPLKNTPPPTPPKPTPSAVKRQDSDEGSHEALATGLSAEPDRNVGYLGATNYSAVFMDSPGIMVYEPCQSGEPYAMSPRTCELAAAKAILRLIPDRASSSALFRCYSRPNDGWNLLAAQILNESVWITYDSILEEDKRPAEGLEHMANTLFRNSSTKFQENHTDPIEWLRSFSGPNLRWESLGMLFTYWALAAKSLREASEQRETEFLRKMDRRELVLKYRAGASMCLDLTRRVASPNTLMACLLHKYSIVESIISGDASPQLWKLHGEIAALATFLGLHVTPPNLIKDHSITSEMKRRLFYMIYKSDNAIASFTGRPTLLSARFSTTPLPLDICDEVLLNTDCGPLEEYPKVDEYGWNTTSALHPMTVHRAKAILSLIREEILEISLQAKPRDENDEQRLVRLRQKLYDDVSRFPASLTYNPADIEDLDVSPGALAARLTTRIGYLRALFMLERLETKPNNLPSDDMLDISIELISLTLMPWKHPERLAYLRGEDCTWLVMSYAAPAVGILAMELLRGSESPRPRRVTRSVMIQQLSMLKGFLSTVGPTAPNTDSCCTVARTVQSVLDRAINGETPAALTGDIEPDNTWGVEISSDFSDLFNYNMLDTFDWMRPEVAAGLVG